MKNYHLQQCISHVLILQLILFPIHGQTQSLSEAKDKAVELFKGVQSAMSQNQTLRGLQLKRVPHNYFPTCQMLPTIPPSANSCNGAPGPNQAQLQAANGYLTILENHLQEYRKDAVPGGNIEGYRGGISCVRENLHKLENSQLPQRIKTIDEMLNKMAKFDAEFRDDIEKNELQPLRELGDLLYNGNNRDTDFANLMQANDCPRMMDNQTIQQVATQGNGGGGLMGIKNQYKPTFNKAQEFEKNAANVAKNIQNNIQYVANKLRQSSLTDFANGNADQFRSSDQNARLVQGTSFQSALQSAQQRYQIKYREYRDIAGKALGSSAEDSKLKKALFSGSNTSNLQKSIRLWETEKDRQCLYSMASSSDQSGLSNLLSTLHDPDARRSGGGQGRNTRVYANQIMDLIEKESTTDMDQRLREIKRLANEGQRSKYRLRLNQGYCNRGAGHLWTVDELFQCFRQDCQKKAKSKANENGVTLAAAKANIAQLGQKIQQAEKNLARDVAQELKDKMLTCESSAQQVSKQNCNENSFDPTKSFCFNQAVACHKSAKSCYAHLDGQIKIKQNRVKQLDNRLTEKVKLYEEKLKNLYSGMEDLYRNQARALENTFGVAGGIPTQLDFTASQRGFKDELGIEGLEISALSPTDNYRQMRENLEALKKEIEDQNRKIVQKVENDLRKMEQNHTRSIGDIQSEIEKCREFINQSMAAIGERDGAARQACLELKRWNVRSSSIENISDLLTRVQNPSMANCLVELSSQLEDADSDPYVEAEELCHSYYQCTTNKANRYECDSRNGVTAPTVPTREDCQDMMNEALPRRQDRLARDILRNHNGQSDRSTAERSTACEHDKILEMCEATKQNSDRSEGKETSSGGGPLEFLSNLFRGKQE